MNEKDFPIQNAYQEALLYAAGAHRDQKVPGTEHPYLVHLCNVAMEVLAAHSARPLENAVLSLRCALLHDTLEDTDTAYDDLLSRFGQDTAAGVKALTKSKDLPKPEAMLDSLKRTALYGPAVGLVKLADRITNLQRPPDHWDRKKIEGYADEARIILARLEHCNEYLAERLAIKIESYAAYYR